MLELAVPERLGRPFRWLLGSIWVSNAGDGLGLAAGPLLVASRTDNPTLVALAALLQRLPWLLLGLYAGAQADRFDRRLLTIAADVARVVVLLVLGALILGHEAGVVVVLTTMFLLGVAETFADTASPAMTPMLVARDDLGAANSRVMGGVLVSNQLVGPPVGALLFAAGTVLPFVTQAVLVLLGVVLLLKVRLPAREIKSEPRLGLRHEIREGLAWVWTHPNVRTLALTILTFNITWGCAWAVLVLYARERLGLGEVGFGLITTAIAAGGVLGIASYGWLEQHVPLAAVMRGVLAVETIVHLALALTTSATLAMVWFFAFGLEAFVWGTTSTTVRQRAVPAAVQGRVSAVYMISIMSGLVVGQALAGPIAHLGGITAPYWFAFAGSAVFLVLIWRQLGHVAHADHVDQAEQAEDQG